MGKSRNKNNHSIRDSKIMWEKTGEKKYNPRLDEEDDEFDEMDSDSSYEESEDQNEIKKSSNTGFNAFNDLLSGFMSDN